MSVRKSLAWSFSQEGIQKIVQFAGSIVIARLLTPDEVGVFSIAMAANFLIGSLREFGVNTYLIREPELNNEKIRTVFGITIAIQWSLAALIFFGRHPFAELYGEPGIADVLIVAVLTFLIGPFGQPALALLRRDMRFDLLHHISAASVIIGTGLTIVLAALGYSYMALAWGMLCGNVVRNGLGLLVRRDHLCLLPAMHYWRDVLEFGGWLTIARLCGTFAQEGRKLVLGGMINAGAVALFERAQQIPQTSRQMLFMPIGRVLLPQFSKNIRDGVSIGPGVEMYIATSTALIWPAFLTIGLLAVPVTVLLFGEDWRFAGEIMPFLLAAGAITAALPQPDQILTPHGHVKRLAGVRLLHALIIFGFAIVGAMYSLEFLAMLTVPAAATFSFVVFLSIRRLMGTTIRSLLPYYGKGVILAGTSGAPALFSYLSYGKDISVLVILLTFFVSGIIWSSGIYVVRHPLRSEMSVAVTWVLHRLGMAR